MESHQQPSQQSLHSRSRSSSSVGSLHSDAHELLQEDTSGRLPSVDLEEDSSAFLNDNNVQVIIRIRPLSSSEISVQGQNRCVRVDSAQSVTWTGHPESRFTFDLVADEQVTQEHLFKVAGIPMVENCMAGYNSCMFAYGQTGSGKTHTMLGDIENGTRRHSVNCGMTPRVFEYLFSRIQKEKEARKDHKVRFTCKCSFLEIYNEQILDLLDPTAANLQIREDAKKGVHIENLTEYEASTARELMQQLIQGAANRKVAATNMNRASSRSHSVFTCVIESKWESQGITHHRFSRLNLVDLAGSERQKSSGAEGERLKEAVNINKSLSTLGLVIMNLIAVSNKKSQHVPYRDSKLTFLLQDSLGGNSKTIIIANISPSFCCSLETLSTLKFAQRAKFIRNNAIVNEDASGDILNMRLKIQQLKEEVNHLRGLVNGCPAKLDFEGSTAMSESPGLFKLDGNQGSYSPLFSDKKSSQRKECDAALASAFRRNQECEAKLKMMAAAKQSAEQLAGQRAEEVRSLKMRLRFREEGIKRLEKVASGKLSAEIHLLQAKEELVKENDALRSQLDRNPELTRFAMENLQLKEELRRLQAFVEDGEREMMHDQILLLQDKLLEALDWKLMHEKDFVSQDLSLSLESSGNEESEFLRLQAIHNEREIGALRKKLSSCLEAKEQLERRIIELTMEIEEQKQSFIVKECAKDLKIHEEESDLGLSDAQRELKALVDAIACASQREAEAHETAIELAKENEELRTQLKDLLEMREQTVVHNGRAQDEDILYMGVQSTADEEGESISLSFDEVKTETFNSGKTNGVAGHVGSLELQFGHLQEENEKLLSLYEKAMEEKDEFRRMLLELNTKQNKAEVKSPVKLMEVDEESTEMLMDNIHNVHENNSHEILDLVGAKLQEMQDKLSVSKSTLTYFKLIGGEVDELSVSAQVQSLDRERDEQNINQLKVRYSEVLERKIILDDKFSACRQALQSFNLKGHDLKERQTDARNKLEEIKGLLEQRREEMKCLVIRKEEFSASCANARQTEMELKNKIDGLKQKKVHYAETLKKEEKVLLEIKNWDNNEVARSKAQTFGRASDLLKSEEETSRIYIELKQAREQLFTLQKKISDLVKLQEETDTKITTLETGIKECSVSLLEAEKDLQLFSEEEQNHSKSRKQEESKLGNLLIEYQSTVFEVLLREYEIRTSEECIQDQLNRWNEIQNKITDALQQMNKLLQSRYQSLTPFSFEKCALYISERIETELEDVLVLVTEANRLLNVDASK